MSTHDEQSSPSTDYMQDVSPNRKEERCRVECLLDDQPDSCCENARLRGRL